MFKDEQVATSHSGHTAPKRRWKKFVSGCCALGSILCLSDIASAQSGYRDLPRFGAVTQTQAQDYPDDPGAIQQLPPSIPGDVPGQPEDVMAPSTAISPTQHPDIVSLPGIHSEVSVIQRRSQLIVTRSRIVQAAVADPSIIDIVQHSPTELSVLGEGLGSTTLTIWFENNPEPLI